MESAIKHNSKLKANKQNREVAPFYDSDEGIGWGPITLKEVKARLRHSPIKPNKRYSTLGLTNTKTEASNNILQDYKMEPITKEDSIPEISEYLTASEQVNLVENSLSTTNYLSAVEGISQNDSLHQANLSSIISIPDIDLHQFNDSCDSLSLNNTLDKINAILKEAENLSLDESTELEPEKSKCNIISASFLQKPSPSPLPDVLVKTRSKETERYIGTPIIKKKKPLHLQSNIPVIKKSPNAFKVPDLSHKPKFLNKPKLNLKNIESPVRMYIKYSPKPILTQNVPSVEKSHFNLNQSPRVFKPKQKENIPEIPNNVVYKPSKKNILASEKCDNFPGSLDKMIKKSTFTKHERTPVSRMNIFRNETLDPEAELTKSFLTDCSTLSEDDKNISIWHKKTALKH